LLGLVGVEWLLFPHDGRYFTLLGSVQLSFDANGVETGQVLHASSE
jgi:hypothetical protein